MARVGETGRVTGVADYSSDGWTLEQDPRATPVVLFLRENCPSGCTIRFVCPLPRGSPKALDSRGQQTNATVPCCDLRQNAKQPATVVLLWHAVAS